MSNAFSPPLQLRVSPHVLPGTDGEIVYRRAMEIISSPQTSELPDSGDGVASIGDLQRALAPLMHQEKHRTADRVVHCLVLLKMEGLLAIDADAYCVTLPQKESA